MDNLPGNITISRTSHDRILIEVAEGRSRCRAILVSIGCEEFGRAVTGMGFVPCLIEHFNDSNRIGMQREHKSVGIVPPPYTATEGECKDRLAPFEVDGWEGSIADLKNRRNDVKDGTRRVLFVRWVAP